MFVLQVRMTTAYTRQSQYSVNQTLRLRGLHVLRGRGTRNDFNELSGNDGLSGTIVKNLVLANHLTSVLGGVLERGSVRQRWRGMGCRENSRPWRCDGQTVRRHGPQPGPSRASWQGCTRGGCPGPHPQPQRRRCWLRTVSGLHPGLDSGTYGTGQWPPRKRPR